jgi:hypothetical protein
MREDSRPESGSTWAENVASAAENCVDQDICPGQTVSEGRLDP